MVPFPTGRQHGRNLAGGQEIQHSPERIGSPHWHNVHGGGDRELPPKAASFRRQTASLIVGCRPMANVPRAFFAIADWPFAPWQPFAF